MRALLLDAVDDGSRRVGGDEAGGVARRIEPLKHRREADPGGAVGQLEPALAEALLDRELFDAGVSEPMAERETVCELRQ